jgi:hypothetical protein
MRDYRKNLAQYGISKQRFIELKAFCYQYKDFQKAGDDGLVALIESAISSATMHEPGMYSWVMEYLTTPGVTEQMLIVQGMPCGRDKFRELRTEVYKLLNTLRY